MKRQFTIICIVYFLLGIALFVFIEIPIQMILIYDRLNTSLNNDENWFNIIAFLSYLFIFFGVFLNSEKCKESGLIFLLSINYLVLPNIIYCLLFMGNDGQQLFYLIPIYGTIIFLTVPISIMYYYSLRDNSFRK